MKDLNSHGGNIWRFKKKGLIDFSASINPLGLPEGLKNTITNNLSSLIHYPEPYSESLRKNFAHFLGVNQRQIAFGNGSIEFIYNLALLLKAKKIGIINPSFSEYEYAGRNAGRRIVFMDTNECEDFRVDMDKLIKFLPKIDLLFLGHPNNPTGQLFYRDEIKYLVQETKRHSVYLIVDEVFIDFLQNCNSFSFLKHALNSKNIIVIRSLTKLSAMAGLRFGYAVSCKEIIKKIVGFQHPWSVNTLAQFAAREVIKNKKYINQTVKFINEEKNYLYEELRKIKGLKPLFPTVNFILCRIVSRSCTSQKLAQNMFKEGILIRDCSNFRGMNNKYFRVAVRTRKENLLLISALKKIFR